MYLPTEVWRRIYDFDPTYKRNVWQEVMEGIPVFEDFQYEWTIHPQGPLALFRPVIQFGAYNFIRSYHCTILEVNALLKYESFHSDHGLRASKL